MSLDTPSTNVVAVCLVPSHVATPKKKFQRTHSLTPTHHTPVLSLKVNPEFVNERMDDERSLVLRTQRRLKELIVHGLLVTGPDALTVDIMVSGAVPQPPPSIHASASSTVEYERARAGCARRVCPSVMPIHNAVWPHP